MAITKKEDYPCPIQAVLDVIGGKWKVNILWHIGNEVKRFNQLNREIPAITKKMLTMQLRDLEDNEMVNRKVYAEIPPRVEYSLTEKGRSILPLLDTMCEWGKRYL